MEIFRSKSKLVLLTTVATLGLFSGGALLTRGKEKRECGDYSGHSNAVLNSDGVRLYVFESEESGKRLNLAGNPGLVKKLERGKDYCYTYTEPRFRFQYKKLKEIEPASEYQK